MLRDLLDVTRLGLARALHAPSRQLRRSRRSVVLLVIALALIPFWQRMFVTKPDVPLPSDHAVFSSTGVHGEPRFFFFLKHLGLYPLRTIAPILADTKEEAERQIKENGPALFVDEGVTFRSGDRGRVYLYYPHAWIEGNAIDPKLQWANAIGFWISLGALFWAFWWIGRPGMGAVLVVLLGSDPFQLYTTYRQENVFGWAITTALVLMAMHLPFMGPKVSRSRWLWALPVLAAFVLGTARTIRGEGSLLAVSAIFVYLTLAKTPWKQRAGMALAFVVTFTLTTHGYTKFFEYKFKQSHAVMVAAGGTPYTGPLQIYHEIWHPIFCGLGDYDTKYGYKWDDRVAYTYALPILTGKYGLKLPPWKPEWYTFDASYDGTGKYPIFFGETPHYNDIIRDKVLGDIRRDPKWYLGILKKRVIRALTETPPMTVHFLREPLHTKSSLIGVVCVPLALFLALTRRWTFLKILVFTTPLTAPAIIIFSDKGMTNYSTYHYFGFAILCALLAEGARVWLRKPTFE